MIYFNSDIKESIQAVSNENIITRKVINYILQDNITVFGFYSLLENNGIHNVQSLKKSFLNLFIDVKNEIIKKHKYLKEEHINDLKIIKQLFQINDNELLYYKSHEIDTIINNQLTYLMNRKEYIYSLQSLLGITINSVTSFSQKKEQKNMSKIELAI